MLTPRLNNCVECSTIPSLLSDIDCRLAEISIQLYNNVIYSLNKNIQTTSMNSLLNYKRILIYKYCTPDYASSFSVNMIASRIKILKFK